MRTARLATGKIHISWLRKPQGHKDDTSNDEEKLVFSYILYTNFTRENQAIKSRGYWVFGLIHHSVYQRTQCICNLSID